jgi:hypothetical protein
MAPFLQRLNANLEKAVAKKKKKSKNESVGESPATDVDARVTFVRDGCTVDPDLSAKVKDFLFQVKFVGLLKFGATCQKYLICRIHLNTPDSTRRGWVPLRSNQGRLRKF